MLAVGIALPARSRHGRAFWSDDPSVPTWRNKKLSGGHRAIAARHTAWLRLVFTGRRTLEGEYGDGSARLEIISFSGDIVIERK